MVAERYVEEGDTVSANTPLISIVELSPMTGEMFVTEKDYARLSTGQAATLVTDAYPGETFEGRIERISPVFRQATRQALIELSIDNPGHRLKPGMFARATVELDTVDGATIVPEQALTKRNEQEGVFVVAEDGARVSWRPVSVGIVEGERVQVSGEELAGRVVTLGQQLLADGSEITIPELAEIDSATPTEAGTR